MDDDDDDVSTTSSRFQDVCLSPTNNVGYIIIEGVSTLVSNPHRHVNVDFDAICLVFS